MKSKLSFLNVITTAGKQLITNTIQQMKDSEALEDISEDIEELKYKREKWMKRGRSAASASIKMVDAAIEELESTYADMLKDFREKYDTPRDKSTSPADECKTDPVVVDIRAKFDESANFEPIPLLITKEEYEALIIAANSLEMGKRDVHINYTEIIGILATLSNKFHDPDMTSALRDAIGLLGTSELESKPVAERLRHILTCVEVEPWFPPADLSRGKHPEASCPKEEAASLDIEVKTAADLSYTTGMLEVIEDLMKEIDAIISGKPLPDGRHKDNAEAYKALKGGHLEGTQYHIPLMDIFHYRDSGIFISPSNMKLHYLLLEDLANTIRDKHLTLDTAEDTVTVHIPDEKTATEAFMSANPTMTQGWVGNDWAKSESDESTGASKLTKYEVDVLKSSVDVLRLYDYNSHARTMESIILELCEAHGMEPPINK